MAKFIHEHELGTPERDTRQETRDNERGTRDTDMTGHGQGQGHGQGPGHGQRQTRTGKRTWTTLKDNLQTNKNSESKS